MSRHRRNTVPYEGAQSGVTARDEITKILRRFGCTSIGFMDDFEKSELLLAFTHRGRSIQLHASAKGWATINAERYIPKAGDLSVPVPNTNGAP